MRKTVTALFFMAVVSITYSQEQKLFDYIHTNNVFMWVGGDASGSHDPRNDDSGLFWDEIFGYMNYRSTVFADGPVLGFKKNGYVNIEGSTYRASFSPFPFGNTYHDTILYISKLKKDPENVSDPVMREFLKYNYENYPVHLGAPFIDNNNDGYYTPYIDEPEISGDEMLWWTSRCNDSVKTNFFYGSPPVELELQTKVWAENQLFPDVIYKEYLFINHEKTTLEDFYFAYWSDPDVGFGGDDFVGVDTLLNMAFAYNGDDNDDGVYFTKPASVGYLLLDGPVVEGADDDTARYQGQIIPGKQNLNLYAFNFMVGGNDVYQDPDLGLHVGAIQFYHILQGKLWNGKSAVDPVTGDSVKFLLAGDPVTGTGWYEGPGWPNPFPPGDRRMIMSTGPFNLEPGDSNCVTIAIINTRAENHLASLDKLKNLANDVRYHWLYEVKRGLQKPKFIHNQPDIPESFTITGNYPNPFNSVTNINLELPQSGNITLTVFNTLGERVREIMQFAPTAGNKSVLINGAGLSSGVYYYNVLFRGETKLGKFVLLK